MNDSNKDNTIFLTGYAKLPSSTTAEKLYEVIAVGAEVDPETGEIIDSDCTLATDLGRRFFKKITVGYSLKSGIEPLLQSFEKRYHGSARKAIITAMKLMYDKWQNFEKENNR